MCVFVYCVSHAFASVYCCLVVTCWEWADLLALVGDGFVFLLLSNVVSWVVSSPDPIFAIFLTLKESMCIWLADPSPLHHSFKPRSEVY